MRDELSRSEARRIALTAQGFNGRRRGGETDARRIGRTISSLGLLQIDSVNVLARAHCVPLFSRLGPYDRSLLDRIMIERPKRFFEYWGHEASLLPVDCHPLLRWRMDRARSGEGVWQRLVPFAKERRGEAEAVLARIAATGPAAASDLAGGAAPRGMWEWSAAKHALEWLFWAGLVSASHRRGNFERVYDLTERVLPRTILDTPTPSPSDARRALLARAARALGVATAGDLRDYHRIPAADAPAAIAELVEEGTILPVLVRGWRLQAFVHRDAVAGRSVDRPALLSPFDPLVWNRDRTERIFGFRYRLEIYTPAHRREYGYYVLPFLLDGALVARIDLKADRRVGVLLVLGSAFEADAPTHAREALRDELERMAKWLGLPAVEFGALQQPA